MHIYGQFSHHEHPPLLHALRVYGRRSSRKECSKRLFLYFYSSCFIYVFLFGYSVIGSNANLYRTTQAPSRNDVAAST